MKKAIAVLAAALLGSSLLAKTGFPVSTASAAEAYAGFVSVTTAESGLNIEPTLVFEPSSFEELAPSASSARPASVIVTPDAGMNVALNGESKSLADVFDEYLKGVYIPVVRLSGDTVDAFMNWVKTVYTISDIMALSAEIGVLQKLYADEVCYLVNTVYDLTETKIPDGRYGTWQYIGEANAAGCNILMFDGGDENLGAAAEYISAMTKVCWAYTEGKTEAAGAVAAGCYGIVGPDARTLADAVSVFKKSGFARAQYVAAHRGVTAYANENSLTAIAGAANEGATHAEIDLQITADGQILICHDSETNRTSRPGFYFATADSKKLRTLMLCDYSNKYEDTYPSLDEVVRLAAKTDMILILELKFDNASARAVDTLKAIETLKTTMEKYGEMAGRWVTITFFAPLAEKMRELLPEIPVGFLGGAASGKETDEDKPGWGGGWKPMYSIADKIAFLRRYNVVLDETYEKTTDTTAQQYLARGYTQNTWTFNDLSHFLSKANVATTNAAEKCAPLVKEIRLKKTTISRTELNAGRVAADCKTYNGWHVEKECDLLVAERKGDTVYAVPYYYQDAETAPYGVYGELTALTVV